MICQPLGEMRTKQLPADFRDWIKARTFEIGAEMALRPDSPQVGEAGVQRANLATVLYSNAIKRHSQQLFSGPRHLEVPELRYRGVSGFELLAGIGGGRPGREGRCLNVVDEILRGTRAAVLEVCVRRGALKLLSAPSR